MAAFANRNGLLRPGRNLISPGAKPGVPQTPFAGDSFEMWREELRAMRLCVELHEAAQIGDVTKLAKHIRWDEGFAWFNSHPDLASEETYSGEHPVRTSRIAIPGLLNDFLREGDVVQPTLIFIQNQINARLSAEPILSVRYSASSAALMPAATPLSLLGAMWLQLASAIGRNVTWRRCALCGKWFEVSAKGSRSDKVFCSSICRVKAHRHRQAENPAGDNS